MKTIIALDSLSALKRTGPAQTASPSVVLPDTISKFIQRLKDADQKAYAENYAQNKLGGNPAKARFYVSPAKAKAVRDKIDSLLRDRDRNAKIGFDKAQEVQTKDIPFFVKELAQDLKNSYGKVVFTRWPKRDKNNDIGDLYLSEPKVPPETKSAVKWGARIDAVKSVLVKDGWEEVHSAIGGVFFPTSGSSYLSKTLNSVKFIITLKDSVMQDLGGGSEDQKSARVLLKIPVIDYGKK